MSPTGQFICFLVALVLMIIAALMRWAARAWDSALVASAFVAFFFVFVVNAAKAM